METFDYFATVIIWPEYTHIDNPEVLSVLSTINNQFNNMLQLLVQGFHCFNSDRIPMLYACCFLPKADAGFIYLTVFLLRTGIMN